MLPDGLKSPSFVVSTPATVVLPALKTVSICLLGRSMITTPLFSCSVRASLFCSLMSTYSGSAASGVSTTSSASAGSAIGEDSHVVASGPDTSINWTKQEDRKGRTEGQKE